jgi:hypothetical protein
VARCPRPLPQHQHPAQLLLLLLGQRIPAPAAPPVGKGPWCSSSAPTAPTQRQPHWQAGGRDKRRAAAPAPHPHPTRELMLQAGTRGQAAGAPRGRRGQRPWLLAPGPVRGMPRGARPGWRLGARHSAPRAPSSRYSTSCPRRHCTAVGRGRGSSAAGRPAPSRSAAAAAAPPAQRRAAGAAAARCPAPPPAGAKVPSVRPPPQGLHVTATAAQLLRHHTAQLSRGGAAKGAMLACGAWPAPA